MENTHKDTDVVFSSEKDEIRGYLLQFCVPGNTYCNR